LADGGQIARLGEVDVASRHAGAMLLYPFVDRLGAEAVMGSLAAGEARRYDAQTLILVGLLGSRSLVSMV